MILFGVMDRHLTQAGMVRDYGASRCFFEFFLFFLNIFLCRFDDADLGRVVFAKSQFISVDTQLHGIAHGSIFDQSHDGSGDDPHVQKMLPQRSFAADGRHRSALSDLKILQCYCHFSTLF